ncbi:MAG: hypothetical protein QOI64_1483, partial [Solirubrobacteraceae bacterium]|nr:hypothetical protein [Solirubrobacteraceae bacterium]
MRYVKRLLAGGLIAGVCAGAIAAVAIPQTTRSPSSPAAAPSVPPAAIGVRRVGAPRALPRTGGYTRLRAVGPVRVAVTVPDPRGGPPWAVRQFLAERLAPDDPDGTGGGHVIGRNRCVQLGRVDRGRFGWLTSDGTFRPVTVSYAGAPTQCLSRRPDLAGHPWADVITTITDPRRSAAEPVQTIVFALAGSAARDPRLTVAGRPAAPARGAGGALLAVLPGDADPADLRLSVRYPKHGTTTILPTPREPARLPARFRNRIPGPLPGAEEVLAAQAPDPDGGLPFGMSATRARDGGFCTSTGGRVVGDRVGGVDYALDIVRINGGSRGTGCGLSGAARRGARLPGGRRLPPFSLGSSFGGGIGAEPGEDP